MAVAPTPPTKPTPPVAPTLTPAGSQNNADQHPAATQAPAVASPGANQPVSPEVSGTINKVEEIRKAFEGMSTKPKTAEPAKPAETGDKVSSGTSQPFPAAVGNTQNAVSSQTTAVPPEPVVSKSKPSITTFLPFFVGVIVLVAIVLVGMRLFKNRSAQTGQAASDSKYVNSNTAAAKEDSTKIIVAPPDTAPKNEGNFEAKV